jgi:hypothetical protein
MAKPVSRPNQIGRAIGYNVDIELLLDKLKSTPLGQWEHLRTDDQFLERVGRAAEAYVPGGPKKQPKRLWVVVKIENSIPVMIDAYRDKHSANKRERFLKLHMRPEMDSVVVFDVKL